MGTKKKSSNAADQSIQKLLDIMAQLRNPKGGCPWDLAQNFKTIVPYTIEEAYEVADAIEQNDMEELKAELGDLLFQVVYHAQMASETGAFAFEDVVQGITEKMISRHPHVFGTGKAEKPEDVNAIWEARKDKEKKRQGAESILDDVPRALPALKRAQKLQNRAARVGFEWPEAVNVLDKLEEEIGEMRAAIKSGRKDEVIDELGDLFFVITNLGRMLGADCEDALTHANNKFTRRFKGIESELKARNVVLGEASLDEMEEIWQAQKKKEKQAAK